MFTSLMLSTNIFSYQSGSSPEKKESHVSLAISASSLKYLMFKSGSEVVSFSRGEIRSGGQGSAEGVVGDGETEEQQREENREEGGEYVDSAGKPY